MAALTADELIERELTKERLRAVRMRAKALTEMRGIWERSFETVGCTCHPARGRVKKLIEERSADIAKGFEDEIAREMSNDGAITEALRKFFETEIGYRMQRLDDGWVGYGSNVDIVRIVTKKIEREHPNTPEIQRLFEEIKATDQVEHPALDRHARASKPFLTLWIMEDMTRLDMDDKDLAEAFATAWVHEGWRPK